MKNLFIVCIFVMATVACKSKIANTTTGAVYKDVDVATSNKMIAENKDLIILDVRTPEETDQGTIPGAVLIDYYASDFDAQISKLDKEKTYLVYCKKGGRSAGAADKMIAMGFTDVCNMLGGYTEWSK